MDIIFSLVLAFLIIVRVFTGVSSIGKIRYANLAAVLLGSMLILRATNIGCDLGRYHTHFTVVGNMSFRQVWSYSGFNKLFYYWIYLVSKVSGGNYQLFISSTAALCIIPPMRLIKRHSKDPYYSILAFYCFGYYTFLYSGLKQAMAMAILCLAFDSLIRGKAISFYFHVLLASAFHISALFFLPAFIIAHRPKTQLYFLFYVVMGAFVFLFRSQLVQLMSDEYSSVISETSMGGVGGKVILIILIATIGYLFATPHNDAFPNYKLIYFKFMIIAAVIQVFAAYGNVFERLSDVYFYYIILYLPEMLFQMQKDNENSNMICIPPSSVIVVKASMLLIMIMYYGLYVLSTPGLSVYKTWLF